MTFVVSPADVVDVVDVVDAVDAVAPTDEPPRSRIEFATVIVFSRFEGVDGPGCEATETTAGTSVRSVCMWVCGGNERARRGTATRDPNSDDLAAKQRVVLQRAAKRCIELLYPLPARLAGQLCVLQNNCFRRSMTPPIPASTVHFTSSRRHKLSYFRAYRPSASFFSGAARTTSIAKQVPSFEVVTGAHPVRFALATFFASCGSINRILTSLFGLIPDNSLLDKCPYYRTACEESTPNLPASLKWVADVESSGVPGKRRVSETKIDSSLVGYRKRYQRDRLTLPAMVVVYNTALAWMMFNIEVSASSL